MFHESAKVSPARTGGQTRGWACGGAGKPAESELDVMAHG